MPLSMLSPTRLKLNQELMVDDKVEAKPRTYGGRYSSSCGTSLVLAVGNS